MSQAQIRPLLVNGYTISANYPFYDALSSVVLKVTYFGPSTDITFNGTAGRLSGIKDGIYQFRVFAVDGKFQADQVLQMLPNYNSVPLRVSIVNIPSTPQIDTTKPSEVLRGMEGFKTYWYYTMTLKGRATGWKSLKYVEETEVLRLQHQQVPQLLQTYYNNHPTAHRFELMAEEYPYEIFLSKEGSISAKKDLRTNLYPGQVGITWQASDTIQAENGLFFKLKLTEEDTLEVDAFPGGTRLRVGSFKRDLMTHIRVTIDFNTVTNQFVLLVEGEKCNLAGTISPEISVQDIEVPDNMLAILQRDRTAQVRLTRTIFHNFIADLETTYYRKKTIKLFASSMFQGYYPAETSEIGIGKYGDTAVFIIPNNETPDTPKPDPETLLMYTLDNTWRDPASRNYKERKTEHLVRLSLQQDFMKEGPNLLGIVLSKRSATPSTTKDDVSEIGEDITKLTTENWAGRGLGDLIRFDANVPAVIQKYFNGRDIRYYKVGTTVYEVLALQPFYNIDTKQWQVVLPFNLLGVSETMFIKFVTLKICPGHGLTLADPHVANSAANPYTDNSGTNLSQMSKPVHFPVYNLKLVTLERKIDKYRIVITRHSEHSKKICFVMLMQDRILGSAMAANDAHASPDLVNFSCNMVQTGATMGKILMFRDDVPIPVEISRTLAQSLLVLEFEQHANLHYHPLSSIGTGSEPQIDDKKIQFVDFNPLFESKGLRLINASEFML